MLRFPYWIYLPLTCAVEVPSKFELTLPGFTSLLTIYIGARHLFALSNILHGNQHLLVIQTCWQKCRIGVARMIEHWANVVQSSSSYDSLWFGVWSRNVKSPCVYVCQEKYGLNVLICNIAVEVREVLDGKVNPLLIVCGELQVDFKNHYAQVRCHGQKQSKLQGLTCLFVERCVTWPNHTAIKSLHINLSYFYLWRQDELTYCCIRHLTDGFLPIVPGNAF